MMLDMQTHLEPPFHPYYGGFGVLCSSIVVCTRSSIGAGLGEVRLIRRRLFVARRDVTPETRGYETARLVSKPRKDHPPIHLAGVGGVGGSVISEPTYVAISVSVVADKQLASG